MDPVLKLKMERWNMQQEAKAIADRLEAGKASAEDQARAQEIVAETKRIDDEISVIDERRRLAPALQTVRLLPGDADDVMRYGTGPQYAQMFGRAVAGDAAGFRSFAEYAAALHSGMWHPSFQALTTSGSVGYLIPPQFVAAIFDQALEGEVVRPRCRIEPMLSDTKTIAGLSHSDGTDAPFGISGAWTAEGAEITPDDPAVRSVTLAAKKLAALVQVSNEAAADGSSLEAQLTEALTKGIGWLLDSAFLTGLGAGQPLGVLNAPCTVVVAKESGQVADTVIYQNLVTMFSRLHPSSVGRAVWVANVATIPQLLQLSLPIGTSGAHIPVMTQTDAGFTILTRPVVFTEKLPTLGDLGDIMLCDFSQYVVGLRAEVILETSKHLGFSRDTAYYRCKVRADGQPLWDKAYTPKSGPTLSPFVTLAAR
jgi:HK97 family phage major capsid protein